MKAEKREGVMVATEAAQALIDRGGLFVLNHRVTDKRGNVSTKPKCRWSIPRSVPKAEKTDSARAIVRFNESEHRPYSASEVVEWQDDSDPEHRAGLFPYTAGLIVVDFDSGSDEDQQAWCLALGDAVCVLRSRNGRGLHAWFKRDPVAKWCDLNKTSFVLPALRGNEPVKADFIPCNGQTIFRDSDSIVRLAEGLQCKGGVMTMSTMRALYECGEGAFVHEALRVVRESEKGQHHNTLMREGGRLFSKLVKEPSDGFVFRALMTIAGLWDSSTLADSERGLKYIGERRDEERLERFRIYKEAREAAGLDVESIDIDGPSGRGDIFDLGHDGLAGICASEGWRLGESRRGRKRLLIDTGNGWRDLSGPRLELMLGDIRRHYRKAGSDDDNARPWFVSSGREMNAILRGVAHDTQVDPFKDYLDGLPDIVWDESAESRLMGMPMRLWRFGSNSRLVGLAFRYAVCGAVARCYEPGVKHDSVLALQGSQGMGKSGFIRHLLPKGMDDLFVRFALKMLGDHDGYKKLVEKINGKVFAEISEIKSTGPSLAEDVKDFISAGVDSVRLPYDNDIVMLPRDAIFIATANRPDFLYADPSGNRRFHGVSISGFATEEIEGNLDGIEHALDGGLRDEWWSLAKSAYRAMGIDSHRPVGDENRLFSVNEEGFEKTTDMNTDVDNLIDGLMLADSEGGDSDTLEWVVPFVSARVITDALGLTDAERTKARPDAAGALKNAMLRRGWCSGKRRVSINSIVKQRVVFWPEARGFPSGYPVMDDSVAKRWVERAVDKGMPVTNADLDSGLSPEGGDESGEGIPF